MTTLPPFEYLACRSLAEAVDCLARHGPEARLMAGGTDLLPGMKRGQLAPRYLVGLGDIAELAGARPVTVADTGEPAGLALGAMTPLSRLVDDPLIHARYPVLAEAAGLIATPALRNMGTVGGNLCLDTRCAFYNRSAFWRAAVGYCLKLDGDVCQVAPGGTRCWAAVSSDLAPVMVALGARARLVGAGGERWLAVEDLYRDDGRAHLALEAGEVLAEVWLPEPAGIRACYLKLRPRAAFDFPSLGVAVALRLVDGRCEAVRVVLGAVASRPVRVAAAETLLGGQVPTAEHLAAAATAVYEAARPMDNLDMPPGYRRAVARGFTERALALALGTAGGPP